MKTKHTVIAACIATLFLGGTVFAKDSWNYHEDQWNNVKSYGKVAIAQDSVEQWGPWEDFAEPAAGLIAPAALVNFAKSEPYRNNPIVNPVPDVGCGAGAWCGYAVFGNQSWQRSQYGEYSLSSEGDNGYTYTGPQAGLFALRLTPDDPNTVTVNGGSGAGTTSWQLTSLTGNVPHHTDSGGNIPASFGDWYYWYYGSQGLHSFYSQRSSETSSGQNVTRDYAYVYGYPHDYYYYWWLPTTNKEVAVGWFERYVDNYVRGLSEEDNGYTQDYKYTHGYYVAGIVTPQAYLDSQRAGNVIATYQGNSFDWSGYQVPVDMTVNFGNATWSGHWNNGSDGNVYTNYDSKGNAYLQGQVGFNASGIISGANIQSTSVSANDGNVTGKVQGTFYGQTAGSIGGVSQIVKTTSNVGEQARTVTVTPTTTAPHTAIFLVDKVVPK